jgi:cell division protein FtsB
MKFYALLLLAFLAAPAAAQDVRGVENCMAEKQAERRSGCLQANVELLQQLLTRQWRVSDDRLKAAAAEIEALKARLTKLESELAQLKAKPAEPAKK